MVQLLGTTKRRKERTMPATGDRITKRKDGLFQGMYTAQTPDGPKRKYIYGRKYKYVEKMLAEAMGDAARGIIADDENMTFGEYLDRWLSDAVRGTVRESTYTRDKHLVVSHIKPHVGRIKLKNVTAMHRQSLYRDRLGLRAVGGHGPEDPPRHLQGTQAGGEMEPHRPQPRRGGQAADAHAEGDAPAVGRRSQAAARSGERRPARSVLRAGPPHRDEAGRVVGLEVG